MKRSYANAIFFGYVKRYNTIAYGNYQKKKKNCKEKNKTKVIIHKHSFFVKFDVICSTTSILIDPAKLGYSFWPLDVDFPWKSLKTTHTSFLGFLYFLKLNIL